MVHYIGVYNINIIYVMSKKEDKSIFLHRLTSINETIIFIIIMNL